MPTIVSQSTQGKEYRRANVFGSIYTLTNKLAASSIAARSLPVVGDDDVIVVNFPAMPDQLPLNRVANYTNAARTPATPDGWHYYEHTDPLEVPIKFSLHAFDSEYCGSDGPVALLNLAAKLHAMAMPILIAPGSVVGKGGIVTGQAPPTDVEVPDGGSKKATLANQGDFASTKSENSSFFYPPACRLDILFAQYGKQEVGIRCDGFVTRVSALLKGPWLQGGGKNRQFYNLPTSADYEFTFVQQPGYTNSFKNGRFMSDSGVGQIVSTSCKQIAERLYNTVDISQPSYYVGITGSSSTGIQ